MTTVEPPSRFGFHALRALPSTFAGLVWAACAAMLIVNTSAVSLGLAAPVVLTGYPGFAPLVGVINPDRPVLRWGSLAQGTFQAAFARTVGPLAPVFPGAVRLRNQLEYSLFGVSANPTMVVGRKNELLQTDYVTEYCSRNMAEFLPFARKWAPGVRRMQDAAEKRGKTFLYVVTPSKPAQYPDFIPRGMPCPAAAFDRAALVPAWVRLLQAAGVHVVDTTAILSAARPHYDFPLFPLGGTHWNALGGHIAGAAVAAALEAQRQDGALPPLPYIWQLDDEPHGRDADLAGLMNLIGPYPSKPGPLVTVPPHPTPTTCRIHAIVFIGGSFANALAEHLSQEPCHPVVSVYEYWFINLVVWHDGAWTSGTPDAARRTHDIETADVLIYEANEQVIRGLYSGQPLFDYLVGGSPDL